MTFFLSSAYFAEIKWLISKKTVIFQGSRGVQHFPGGGVQLFPRGVQLFQGGGPIPYIACDFPGGGGPDPLSPPTLDPHL